MVNRGEEKVRVHMNGRSIPEVVGSIPTVDLFLRGRGFDSHRGQKIFSLARVVPCFPLLGLTLSGLFMGLSST